MLILPTTISRRNFLGASAALGVGSLTLPARAEPPKLRTVEDGYITIAMSGTMPMTGFQDGKLTGADATMVQAIAEKLGLKAKPAIMAWAATIQAIRSGRADIMCGDMGWTKARADAMLLTDPLYYDTHFLTMKKDRPSPDSMDLDSLKGSNTVLGTITGTSYAVDARKVPGISEVKLYDNVDACTRDLIAGRIDVAVLDSMIMDYLILQRPDVALKQVPIRSNPDFPSLSGKSIAIAGMSLENPDLFDAMNAGIKWLWQSKTNTRLLAANGMTSPEYLVPPTTNRRLDVDRDAAGTILGAGAHTPKDFSAYFS